MIREHWKTQVIKELLTCFEEQAAGRHEDRHTVLEELQLSEALTRYRTCCTAEEKLKAAQEGANQLISSLFER